MNARDKNIESTRQNRRRLNRRAPNPLALEARLMFDGAAVATVAATEPAPADVAPAATESTATESTATETAAIVDAVPVTDGAARDSAVASPTAAEPVEARQLVAGDSALTGGQREIAFVDSSIAQWRELADAIRPGVEVVLIDGGSDGLEQIAQYLQGRDDIDAVHILAHGSEADATFGSVHLTADSVAQYQDTLSRIGSALATDGDLLLYGCDIGKGAAGLGLIGQLAQATGADVAASSDLTGAAARGGDWVLEVGSGQIEASVLDLVAYDGVLRTTQTATFGSASGDSSTPAIVSANVAFSGSGTLVISANDVDFSQGERDAVYIKDGNDTAYRKIYNSYGDNYLHGSNAADFSTTFTINQFDAGTMYIKVVGEVSGWVFRVNSANLTVFTNEAPVVTSTSLTTAEDTTLTRSLSTLGSDADGDPLTYTLVSGPSHGTVSFTGGNMVYTPTAGYYGPDSFTYKANDGYLDSGVGTINLTVSSVNDTPVLGGTGSLAYIENQAARAIFTGFTASDDGANFNGGYLQAQITTNGAAEDQLSVLNQGTGAGQIGVSGSTVTYGGTTIGTIDGVLNGANNTAIKIALNGNATAAATQALARAIAYRDSSDAPSTATRTVTYTLNDGGNTGSGGALSTTRTASISVAAVDDPAVLTLASAATYVENNSNFFIDPALTLADVDSPTLDGAKVVIGSGFKSAEDRLLPASGTTNGITYSYDQAKGVLTLSGTASIAQYEAALRAVKYNNISENPDQTPRTISFTLGNKVALTIGNVTHYYEAVAGPLSWTAAEAAAKASTFQGLTGYLATITSQAENDFIREKLTADAWIGATDSYTYINAATGTTTYASQSAAEGHWYWVSGPEAGTRISDGNVSPVTASGSYAYWNSNEPNNSGGNEHYGEIYSTGAAPGKWNDLPNTSTLAYVVEYSDNGSGSSSFSKSIVVTPQRVNDAPVTSGTVNLTSITENATTNSGQLVSSFMTASDPDTAAVTGIALTGLTAGNGTWQYSLDNGATWVAVGTVGDNGALLLRTTDRIRYVPDALNADSASITYRAWDRTNENGTSIVAGQKVDVSANGNTAAYSSGTQTGNLTVTAVNDAPVLTPAAPTLGALTEDDTANAGQTVAVVLGTSVADVDSGAVQGIAITSLNAGNGTWEYNTGSGWTAVGAVAGNSALLLRSTDQIRFRPDGMNGTAASFTYKAWDRSTGTQGSKVDASVGGGTTAFSTSSDTASIAVSSVNDAPVLSGAALTFSSISEDNTSSAGQTVASLLGTTLTDVDSGAVKGVAIEGATLAGNGRWEYDSGSGWTAVGSVTSGSALLLRATDKIRFVPDTLVGGTATLTVRGWDTTSGSAGTKVDTTTKGGTTAFSTATATASITVNSIDDTPSFADSSGTPALPTNKAFSEAAAGSPASGSVPTPVDTTLLLRDDGSGSSIKSATVTIASGFTAGDVLAAVTTGTSITASFDAASGVLTLSGPDTVAHYQSVLRSVTFASTSEDPTVNSASRSLAWRVTDTTNLSSALITSLVTVTPTVDAPLLAGPASLDYTEDDGLRILAPTLTLADSDDTSQAGARVILSTGSGSLDSLDKGTEYLTLRGASPAVNGSGEYAWTLTNVMGYAGVDASYSWDAANSRGVLVISGTASTAAYQQILRTVSYANATNYTVGAQGTPTVGTRDVKWQLIDANSDGVGADSVSALLGSGTGNGSLSNEITQTVTLKNANEAPQVAGAGVVLSYSEGDTVKILANAIVPSDDNSDGALSSARVQVTAGLTQGDLLAVAADSNASDGYTHAVSGNTVTLTWNGVQVTQGLNGGFEEQTLSALPALVVGQVFTLTADGIVLTATLGATPTTASLAAALQADAASKSAGFIVSNSGNNLVLTWGTAGDKPAASLVSTETVTAAYDSASGVLQITGNATIAAYQSMLRSVTFGNTTNDDLTASSSTRTVQWRVVDSAGVPSAVSAVDGGATTTINVTAINDPSVVTPAAGTYTFTEGGPAIIANAGLTLSDPDDTNATSASVVISGASYESSKEFLSFVGVTPTTGSMAAGADWTATNVFGSGLNASFTAATGTLALTGTASSETFQAVLRRVAYSNASDNPGSGTRTLTWTVGDGFASRLTDADATNNATAGTNTSATSLITLSPRNDAPVLASGLGGTASYTEGAAAALLASAVTLTDVDDTQLSGARVWISSGFTAGDTLSVATPGGLTVAYDGSTGVLTLSGTASVADYQAALQSLGFSSSSNDPTAISATRALSWQVTDADASGDGALASAIGASSLDITAADDAASVSGLPANGSITFTENASPVLVAPALELADTDDGTLVSASVVITGGLTAGDVLVLGGNFSAAGISATYNAGTGTLTLTGPASIADFQSALRAVTFTSSSDDPSASASTRSLSWTTISAFASRLTDASAGNDATGGSTSGAVTSQVSLSPLNDAPSLALDDGTPSPSDAPVFEQGSSPVFAIRTGNTAGGVTITDPDLGDQIASASVRLSANWLATDVLSIATPAGWSRTGNVFSSGGTSVTATYDAGTGTLSFSGLASRADYETLLGNVKFDNSSVAPTASGASRELTWTVTDSNQAGDGARSATTTSQLTIRDRNDAPTVVPAAPAAAYAEGAESVSVPALTITDPDPGEIVTATLTLSDPAAGTLSVSGGASYNPLTGVWTLSGTVANVNAALAALSFVPATDYDRPVTLSYQVADGGEDGAAPATGSVALNVTAANDAPVLTPASPVLPGLTEDDTDNAGVSVASFRGAIVDVDTGAQQGIVVTDLASGNGTWQYSLDGGSSWLDVGSVSTTSALALRDSDKLRFVPDGNNATTAGFTYRAWDRSSGSAGNMLDASSTGNATPFSSAADTASLSVGAVNDAPVLAAASPVLASLTENDTDNAGQSVASLLGGSISDVDSGAQQGIAITGLDAGNGAWQYSLDDGASWVTVSGVTTANALLLRSTDLIRFQPDTLNGTTASFDYKAWDRSTGNAGGRGDTTVASAVTGAFSATGNTASITATPVNDAPELAPQGGALPALTEDDIANAGQTVASLLGGSVSDVDTGAQQGIIITDLASGNGTWQYSLDGGSSWLDVGSVSTTGALALRDTDKLRFVPDGKNATTAGFTYRAWDRSSGSAGSKLDASSTGNATPFSSSADTASLTVDAVNDAPVLAAASPVLTTLTEDDTGNAGQSVASLLGSTISDVDSGAQQGIAITGLDAGNGAWQYSLDDGASWVTVSGVTAADALLLRSTDLIRFQPDTLNGTPPSFDYKAWDRSTGSAGGRGDTTTASAVAGAFSATGNTARITATPVNDAPINDVLPSFSGGARGDGSLRQDGLLTAVPGQWHDVDAGSPATTFQYQWEVADDAAGTNLRVIDGATAASYQLTAAEIGKFVRVRVTGSDGEAETVAHSNFTRVSNEAPLLSNPLPLQEITQSVPLNLVLPGDTFTDANPEDTLYFTATLADGSPLPAWLSFDPLTRAFTGTPGGGDIGDLSIRVTVSDHGQRDASMDFTLRVLALPVKQADPVAPAAPAAPPAPPVVEASPVAPSDAGFIRTSGNEGLSVTATEPVLTPQATAFVPPAPPVAARDTSVATTSAPAGGLTRSDGFQVVVAPPAASGEVALLLVRPLNDQLAAPSESIRIAVPPDTFSHTLREAVVSLSAQRTDGQPLPGWLRFDAQKGEFRGVAPVGFEGDIEVKVVARDNFGNEVSTIFRFSVKPKVKAGFMGRDGLSAQLRAQSPFTAVQVSGERVSLSGQAAERGAKFVGRGRVVG